MLKNVESVCETFERMERQLDGRYVPAPRLIPGICTDALKVKDVRLSNGWADAAPVVRQTRAMNAQARATSCRACKGGEQSACLAAAPLNYFRENT